MLEHVCFNGKSFGIIELENFNPLLLVSEVFDCINSLI